MNFVSDIRSHAKRLLVASHLVVCTMMVEPYMQNIWGRVPRLIGLTARTIAETK